MMITGATLRNHREQLGLSQAKLAEATGIPQHALSAFELGRALMSPNYMTVLQKALANENLLEELRRRKKRYKQHAYKKVIQDPKRINKCKRTKGNIDFCNLLESLDKERTTKKDKQFSALSLFSGCGGFSLGFSWADFEVKGFLELDPDLCDVYRENFPSAQQLGNDITKVSDSELKKIVNSLGKVDVLIGGPPCQGFSLSGKRKVDDSRNSLFRHYMRFVEAVKPSVAIIENVRVLTSMKNLSGGLVKDEIEKAFGKQGYKVAHFEVNAKKYGVPQHRERVLFIAIRNDLPFQPSIPVETHGDKTNNRVEKEAYRTFADACSDLPYIESGETSLDQLHEAVAHPQHVIDWLWDVAEGFSAHENKDPDKRPPSGYNTTYKRQVWFEPASTVQTTFGMISGCRNVHPIATRSLTIREAARIQSFPDTYAFKGKLGTIRTGIGNAVPPLLAYSFATYIRDNILKLIKVSGF